MKLTDQSLMPFGEHTGTPMEKVPASYLLWAWNEFLWRPIPSETKRGSVRAYIVENIAALEKECPSTIISHDPRREP